MGSHDLVRFRKCRTGISHTNANCKIYFIKEIICISNIENKQKVRTTTSPILHMKSYIEK